MSGIAGKATAKNGAGTLAVTVGGGQNIPASTDRRRVYVSNCDATNPVFAALGPTAAANSGIRIGPGQTQPIEDYDGQITFISTGGTVNVAFADV